MRNRFFALPLMVLLVSFVSCLDTKEEPIYYDVMATLTEADGFPTFQTDNGYILQCDSKLSTSIDSFKTGNRFYMRYSFGDTTNHAPKIYPIKLSKIWYVTVKNFVTVEKDSLDKFGSQPLEFIYSLGIGGKYLNATFNTFTSMSNKDGFELVRIKKDEPTYPQDTPPTIYFQLRHTVASITTFAFNTRIASFDLSPLVTEYPLVNKININLKYQIYPYTTTDSCTFVYEPKAVVSVGLSPKRTLKPDMKLSASEVYSNFGY